MDSGFVKDKKGQLIPAHHIEVVQFEHGGKTVFTALWGPAVSKDPYVKFSFKGGKKGDDLKVSWVDNKGAIGFVDGQDSIRLRQSPGSGATGEDW